MNTNIQGDFQICISVPLQGKHVKTTMQKWYRNEKRPVYAYLKDSFTEKYIQPPKFTFYKQNVSNLLNVYRQKDSRISCRFLVWISQPSLSSLYKSFHDCLLLLFKVIIHFGHPFGMQRSLNFRETSTSLGDFPFIKLWLTLPAYYLLKWLETNFLAFWLIVPSKHFLFSNKS